MNTDPYKQMWYGDESKNSEDMFIQFCKQEDWCSSDENMNQKV